MGSECRDLNLNSPHADNEGFLSKLTMEIDSPLEEYD